jgi:hypothetical protein
MNWIVKRYGTPETILTNRLRRSYIFYSLKDRFSWLHTMPSTYKKTQIANGLFKNWQYAVEKQKRSEYQHSTRQQINCQLGNRN